MRTLETVIPQLISNIRREIYARPLFLGGTTGSGGGVGGPPGGFIGVLPQTRIAFDLSEEATDNIPASGASLLDNLNRIRYRIANNATQISTNQQNISDCIGRVTNLELHTDNLEVRVTNLENNSNIGGISEVLWNGIVVAQEVTRIDFSGNIVVRNSGNGLVSVCVPKLEFIHYSGLTDSTVIVSGALDIIAVYQNRQLLFDWEYTTSGNILILNSSPTVSDIISVQFYANCSEQISCGGYGDISWGDSYGSDCSNSGWGSSYGNTSYG